MSKSEEKAKEYADQITSHIGSEPMYMPLGMIRFALKMAFEAGYKEGEIEMMCNYSGIREKENILNKETNQ